MAAELLVTPAPALDSNGNPLSGAKWYFYATGTTTPQNVYADSTLLTSLGAVVTADSAGRFADIYFDPAQTYRGILKTSDGATTLYDIDPINDGVLASLAASSGSSLVGFIQSGTGATARTMQDKARESFSVKDFGAVGDGVTNDRAAIAAAVLAGRGKRVVFPEGNYVINTDGGSITLEEVELCGEGVLDGATGTVDQGVNLWVTGTTNSLFKMRRGSSLHGLGIYYPNQTDNAAPTVYPVTVAFDFTNGAVQFCRIEGLAVYNAYRFLDIDDSGTGNVGHIEVIGNYICGLNRGIYISHNLEHIRVQSNNFTFGFWLAATEGGSRGYMRANATAIQVQKSDGVEIVDNLFFGYLNAILTSASGLCQFMTIQHNKFDQVRFGVKATGSGNFTGAISGNTFNCFNGQATSQQARSISIETTGVARETITITGNNFLLATEDHIYTTGNNPTRNIVVGPQNFLSWAAYKSSGTYGALNINGSLTNLDISGGWLVGSNSTTYSYGITGSFNTLNCTGVTFDACQRPISATVNYITGSGNVSFATGHTVSDVYSATYKTWGPNKFDKPQDKTPLTLTIGDVPTYADDAAAAAGGIPVGGVYRNASVLMIRVA